MADLLGIQQQAAAVQQQQPGLAGIMAAQQAAAAAAAASGQQPGMPAAAGQPQMDLASIMAASSGATTMATTTGHLQQPQLVTPHQQQVIVSGAQPTMPMQAAPGMSAGLPAGLLPQPGAPLNPQLLMQAQQVNINQQAALQAAQQQQQLQLANMAAAAAAQQQQQQQPPQPHIIAAPTGIGGQPAGAPGAGPPQPNPLLAALGGNPGGLVFLPRMP